MFTFTCNCNGSAFTFKFVLQKSLRHFIFRGFKSYLLQEVFIFLLLLKTDSRTTQLQNFDWFSGHGIYEPLYNAPQIWYEFASRRIENIPKSARFSDFHVCFLIKQLTRRAFNHLISNARSWNNGQLSFKYL